MTRMQSLWENDKTTARGFKLSTIRRSLQMSRIDKYPEGMFNWVDLGTSDAPRAKQFYSSLLGWSMVDYPMNDNAVYTLCQKNGLDVAAIFQLEADAGMSPRWNSYISVAHVDEMTEQARQHGARIIKEPFDVFNVGRMAIIQDPTLAIVYLWQPKEHQGAKIVNEPGAFCWNELLTSDTQKAGDFYTQVMGWEKKESEFGPMTYTSFSMGEHPNGGMLSLAPGGEAAHSYWLVYFAIADCDQSTEKAKSLGATLISGPQDRPDVGRFSIMQDPQGAVFALIALANLKS